MISIKCVVNGVIDLSKSLGTNISDAEGGALKHGSDATSCRVLNAG